MEEKFSNTLKKANTPDEDYHIDNSEGWVYVSHSNLKTIKQEMENSKKDYLLTNILTTIGLSLFFAAIIPLYQSGGKDMVLVVLLTMGICFTICGAILRTHFAKRTANSDYSCLEDLLKRAEEARQKAERAREIEEKKAQEAKIIANKGKKDFISSKSSSAQSYINSSSL